MTAFINLANSNAVLRTIMGIESESNLAVDRKEYGLTTIKNNLALLDKQNLGQINDIVLSYGHRLLKKNQKLRVNQPFL